METDAIGSPAASVRRADDGSFVDLGERIGNEVAMAVVVRRMEELGILVYGITSSRPSGHGSADCARCSCDRIFFQKLQQ
jgi:hypothetical protein